MIDSPFYRSPKQLFEELGIIEPGDIDIEAIAEYCGATIVYEPLKGCEARILGHANRAIISINSLTSSGRQRFSAGHELGHWMSNRGEVALSCIENVFISEWSQVNKELHANRYATDLLLPEHMFSPRAKNSGITFSTVNDLAGIFQTSLTATAIRLVECGSFPAIIVCSESERIKWFIRGPYVPEILWPSSKPGYDTLAYELLHRSTKVEGPVDVNSSEWFEHSDAYRYVIREDSIRITSEFVLSLLWWKDERQLLDLEED